MKTKAFEYSKKTLTFLDILGFERIVSRSENNPELVGKIVNILARSKNIASSNLNAKLTILKVNPQEYTYRAFSDTSIISGPYSSDDDMSFLSMWVMYYQYFMWKEESAFIRGAAVYGDMYQDQEIVFGPALIDAYHLESQETKASWPRVLIGDSLLNKLSKEERERAFYEFLRRGDDNLVYLDYLRELFHLLSLAENKKIIGERQEDFGEPIKLFEDHKKAILGQVNTTSKQGDRNQHKKIIGKYVELSNYHNATIDNLRHVIEGLLSNPAIIRAVFDDHLASFTSKQSGSKYDTEYSAEEHPDQADMLNIICAVTNVIIRDRQEENITLQEALNDVCLEMPKELSILDVGLQKALIDTNSLSQLAA
ncbi:MAG: hypothetical protein HYX80_03620 [Chloroflexi bacterium]|nr:hypothetical protein [Chloroflexota bacterium]